MLYIDYLLHDTLSATKTEARLLARRAKSFVLVEGKLYKRSHTRILQLCIPIEQEKLLLSDIHGGVYGHHAATRTLVRNVFRQGFYWPTAVADAKQIVHNCEGCQYYTRQTHLLAQALQTIPITWLFLVWGLNLVGSLKRAPRGYTHLLVAVDKFTKWIEARPISAIKSEQAVLFFLDIVHRFGVPNSIIMDNGT